MSDTESAPDAKYLDYETVINLSLPIYQKVNNIYANSGDARTLELELIQIGRMQTELQEFPDKIAGPRLLEIQEFLQRVEKK